MFSQIQETVRRVHKSETLKEHAGHQGPKTYVLVQGCAASARDRGDQELISWLWATLETLCKNASAAQWPYDHQFCCQPVTIQIVSTKKHTFQFEGMFVGCKPAREMVNKDSLATRWQSKIL